MRGALKVYEKTAAIIQARTGSTRLPGKVLKKVSGKTILEHVIQRVRQSTLIDEIIIATTDLEQDRPIIDIAEFTGVRFFRGSEEDVLARYYYAAKDHKVDVIVRVTSDCPLIDPIVCDTIINFYKQHFDQYDLVTNAGPTSKSRSFPRGLDVEVFSVSILKKAFLHAHLARQREHVTPWIYESNSSKVYFYRNDVDHSKLRWTLDTDEDFLLIKTIYDHFYRGKHDFYYQDIMKLFNNNHGLAKINEHVIQKN